MTVRILVVDDNEIARRGMRSVLSQAPELTVCGEAADGVQALESARALHPDAILMDVSMPRMDGLEATRAIRKELGDVKVVIISQNDPAILCRQAAAVEAHGYINKANLSRDLIPSIEKIFDRTTTRASLTRPESDSFPWMAGGGAMGALMRATEWSETSLGPAESWSPALRMMVKFLLANRFPQLLWWGPQFCCLYNDAYVPILGAKHPWAIGRTVSEVWSEIWHILKPLVETPFKGGPATWIEDIPLEINRSGFVEETHFTIAYSPVPDETVPDGIGGVLATVHEITEKVVGERRIIVLRDLGARSVEPKSSKEACTIAAEALARHSKDVPFVLLYLLDASQKAAELVASSGIETQDRGCPKVIDLASLTCETIWPLSKMIETEEIQPVSNLDCKFQNVPQGPWLDPPSMAAIVPIRSNIPHQLAGFMVAGISSRLVFDESYRSFLELMSTQIATTVANARAYEEERKRAEALADIDRAKTLFFSNVSHEFRTPLTLMLGPLQDLLAKTDAPLSPAVKEQLELMSRNGARLLRLVNTLLDFSRIEAGRVQAVYQPTDLASFTAELASAFRSATERVGLDLRMECKEIGEPVYVDHDMWEKIVLNLISNAFKFTFEGEIVVSLGRAGDAAELRIRDTGVGIPAEALPKLFERFHRVANTRSRTYEGTGIGLALVHELLKLHGGSVDVESVVGQGTTFIIRIPLGRAHLPPTQVGNARSESSVATDATAFVEEALSWLPEEGGHDKAEIVADGDPVTRVPVAYTSPPNRPLVLIADDNPDMRQYLARILGERFEVQVVSDGQAALTVARKRPPDLVLTDVMMPKLNGLQLLREWRADPVLGLIPVILLSARAGEESLSQGMETGADDYLAKPFSTRELIARVEAHVKVHHMRRQAQTEIAESKEKYRRLAQTLEEQVRARTEELEQRNADIQQQAQALRELSARLLQIQDEERRHIARELHDSAGQTLAAIGLVEALIAHRLQEGLPELSAKMEELQTLTAALSQEIRTTSYLLHPPMLDESGVVSAVQWYVSGFNARSETQIRLEIGRKLGRCAPEIELVIFRVIQEALTNIHRHAESKTGTIRIRRNKQEVSLEIQDYGKGMSANKLNEIRAGGGGVGFRGMRERVHQLGGELRLDSDSSGTRLLVILSAHLAIQASPTLEIHSAAD